MPAKIVILFNQCILNKLADILANLANNLK